jgi:transposase
MLEQRRRQAMTLLKSGLCIAEITQKLKCSKSSVMRWRAASRRYSRLGSGRIWGRPPKVHRGLLGAYLERHKHRWRTPRDAAVLIERRYHVHYHADHVRRILRKLGWVGHRGVGGWTPPED